MASVRPSTSLAKWGQIAPLLFCGVAPHPPGQAGRPPCVPVPGGVRIRPPTSAEIEFVISLLQSLSCSSFAVSHRRRRPRSRKVKTSGGQRNATLCEFATELTRDGGKEAPPRPYIALSGADTEGISLLQQICRQPPYHRNARQIEARLSIYCLRLLSSKSFIIRNELNCALPGSLRITKEINQSRRVFPG